MRLLRRAGRGRGLRGPGPPQHRRHQRRVGRHPRGQLGLGRRRRRPARRLLPQYRGNRRPDRVRPRPRRRLPGASDIGWLVEVSEANPNAYVNVVSVEQTGGEEDADADGATADQEAQYGTDPANPDTDDDGASDGQEITYGEPGPSPTIADSDGDGLLDGVELNETGTNPTGGDSDGDQISDGDEVAAGTDPLDPDDPAGGDGQ